MEVHRFPLFKMNLTHQTVWYTGSVERGRWKLSVKGQAQRYSAGDRLSRSSQAKLHRRFVDSNSYWSRWREQRRHVFLEKSLQCCSSLFSPLLVEPMLQQPGWPLEEPPPCFLNSSHFFLTGRFLWTTAASARSSSDGTHWSSHRPLALNWKPGNMDFVKVHHHVVSSAASAGGTLGLVYNLSDGLELPAVM